MADRACQARVTLRTGSRTRGVGRRPPAPQWEWQCLSESGDPRPSSGSRAGDGSRATQGALRFQRCLRRGTPDPPTAIRPSPDRESMLPRSQHVSRYFEDVRWTAQVSCQTDDRSVVRRDLDLAGEVPSTICSDDRVGMSARARLEPRVRLRVLLRAATPPALSVKRLMVRDQ